MDSFCVPELLEAVASRENARLDKLIRFSGARLGQSVCVAGRGAVDLLVALCQRQFQRVACVRRSTGASADEGNDVLIVGGSTVSECMIASLSEGVKLLKDGGALVARLDRVDDDCEVQACLTAAGREITSTVFELSDEVLVRHTVRVKRAA